jgi:hypothetical protein
LSLSQYWWFQQTRPGALSTDSVFHFQPYNIVGINKWEWVLLYCRTHVKPREQLTLTGTGVEWGNTCCQVMVRIQTGFGFMIGFIGLSDTARGYTLQFTVTHTHTCPVTSSLPLLGSGLQRRTFPFLLGSRTVPGLSYQLLTATAHNDWLTHSPANSTVCHQSQSQIQTYFTTDGLPPISSSWRQAPWGSRPEIFFFNWTLSVIVLR